MFDTLKNNLNTYNNILRRNIREAKSLYYNQLFDKFKNDIRNTWITIKEIINKTSSKSSFPDSFIFNDVAVSDPQQIADNFNDYFSNIGPNLASKIIPPRNKTFNSFLQNPPLSRFKFEKITEENILKLMLNFKPKTSRGIDGISMKLLKCVSDIIVKPITFLVNQAITSGTFPNKLKIAKVMPVYKKDDNTLPTNYRPISILPTVSKIFEKVLFNQIYEYFAVSN